MRQEFGYMRWLLSSEDNRLINRAKQGWQENTADDRNRTEAASLIQKGTCVGIAGGVFESDEERRTWIRD
jgi:hypothetical protein